MKKSYLIGAILIAIGIIWLTWDANQQPINPQASITNYLNPRADEAFARALGDRPLVFPLDHGAHPGFQTEWWYYTGNLQAVGGEQFGYQLTFFRRALVPLAGRAQRPSGWAADQVYMAHFALTDIAHQEYQAFERLSRDSLDLAGVHAEPFRVWLQDWSVEEIDPDNDGLPRYHLQARQGTIELDLIFKDTKGPILQGDQGFSRKGPQDGQASYYYSFTRLETQGLVKIGSNHYAVQGSSWMDHEFSTSVLSQDQVGWDWFSFHFDDGSELMVFQIRKADGSIDPFSSGTWIAPDGSSLHLARQDFSIQVTDTWQSPHSGTIYPSNWVLKVPKLQAEWVVEPSIPDQELNLSYTYWEGAVKIDGQFAGQVQSGKGYVELTGYADSMGGEF